MADAADSKSAEGDFVWVQVPSPAYKVRILRTFSFCIIADITCRKTSVFLVFKGIL